MTVDSGAAVVTLSWKTAEQSGLTPGPADPGSTLTIANGKAVTVKMMVLESVQVGPFVVHNVECAVLPQSLSDAPNLLGGTFLRHFVYNSDLANGELHMTQLTEPTKKEETAARPTERTAAAKEEPAGLKGDGFAVPSSGAWVPVAFNVEAGKCYEIKARGKWTGANGPATGPEGLCPPEVFSILGPQPYQTKEQQAFYLGQFPRNALVGRIGAEEWSFYVGPGCRFVAPVSGPLSFRMNDTSSASPAREGKLEVTVAAVTAEWVDRRGLVEIIARVDDQDRLHVTRDGIYWEWGGQWGKVGLHDGYWPTVVSGIYWWPKWSDEKQTEPLAAPAVWPQNPSRFQIARVDAKRGKAEVVDRGATDIVIAFSDQGLGSTQVGCVVSTGNSPAPEKGGRRGGDTPARGAGVRPAGK
jgi:clan AA aspartic protease (TIGR02281 family)